MLLGVTNQQGVRHRGHVRSACAYQTHQGHDLGLQYSVLYRLGIQKCTASAPAFDL